MRERLNEYNTKLLKETIEIHRLTRVQLKDWREKLMGKCKECIANKGDDRNGIVWKCDCDIQFFLDMITELLQGNGGF